MTPQAWRGSLHRPPRDPRGHARIARVFIVLSPILLAALLTIGSLWPR